ncbi:MAG: signal transduction histidine kinase/ActR/RegA family two-component response regulator, partial [Patiriisocius sp.]
SIRSVDGNFLKQSAETQHFLAAAYEKNGDGEAAIRSLKKNIEFDKKFNKIIRAQQLQEVSARLQLEQYQKEIGLIKGEQLLSDQLANKSNQLMAVFIATSIILFLATIAAFMLYRNRKNYLNNLNAKHKELILAKEEAERLSKLKTQFFSTVSHELRTPLYGVIGLSSILLEDAVLASHKEDLKSLKFSADYLLALINDVLTLNKADANGMKLEKSPFKLSLLIKNITASFSFSLQQNNNKVNVVIDEAIPDNMLGDSIKLSQILMNLVGNAVKFNENGTIEIIIKLLEKTTEGRYRVQFFIKDNGIGIPKEKHALIFEEFSQVEHNNYNYQGTGLGLPIVKKLLAVYDSEIELKSEVGNGSIFSFIIPLEQNLAQIDTDFKPVSQETNVDKNASFENIHILIVDDNKINQKVTQKILQSKNFRCSLADDGIQAVTMAQKNDYGLILMDIHMPNMGGVEATKAIRNFNKNIPIIALTAVEIEEAREKTVEAGMDDIILKPYDVAQFFTTIFRNLTPKSITR